jgi:hypothetical protein
VILVVFLLNWLTLLNHTFRVAPRWQINFVLGVVSGEGLQIVHILNPGESPACTSTSENHTIGIEWKVDWSSYTDHVGSKTNDIFENNTGAIENNVIYILSNQDGLFFPVSGAFLMEDVDLNCGDLRIEPLSGSWSLLVTTGEHLEPLQVDRDIC